MFGHKFLVSWYEWLSVPPQVPIRVPQGPSGHPNTSSTASLALSQYETRRGRVMLLVLVVLILVKSGGESRYLGWSHIALNLGVASPGTLGVPKS